MHSVPGFFNGGVSAFGTKYLDTIGFAPFGLYLAWAIKLSHIGLVVSLITDKWVRPMVYITILILVSGIYFVHMPEGWFVIGGGRNGIEFNIFLILALGAVLSDNYRSKI